MLELQLPQIDTRLLLERHRGLQGEDEDKMNSQMNYGNLNLNPKAAPRGWRSCKHQAEAVKASKLKHA